MRSIIAAGAGRGLRAGPRRAEHLCLHARVGRRSRRSWAATRRACTRRPPRCRIRTTSRRGPASSRARAAPTWWSAPGAELEVGWLPLVLTQSGNPKIQLGQPGYFEAASAARLIEVPQRVDRSMGDVHPAGNPHLHLDPRNIARVAKALAARMSALDAQDAAYYIERELDFQKRWREATARWEREAAPLQGPAAGRVPQGPVLPDRLARHARGRHAGAQARAAAVRGASRRAARSAQADAGEGRGALGLQRPARRPTGSRGRRSCPSIVLPFTVGGTEQAKDLFGLYDDTHRETARGGQMNWAAIDFGLLWPALAAGLLVTATHVPLGIQVLARGIVFIDLAVAQIAGLGVVLADWLGFEPHGAAVQVAALGAALAGALLLDWTERRWPEVQEAVIGVSFIVAANAAILLLAANPHGAEHLKDLLVGQILWVSPASLLPVALASARRSWRSGSGSAPAWGAPGSTCCSPARSRSRCSSWACTSCSPRSSCRRSPRATSRAAGSPPAMRSAPWATRRDLACRCYRTCRRGRSSCAR